MTSNSAINSGSGSAPIHSPISNQPATQPPTIPSPATIAKTDSIAGEQLNVENPSRTSRTVTPVNRNDPGLILSPPIPFDTDDLDSDDGISGSHPHGRPSTSSSAPLTDDDDISVDAPNTPKVPDISVEFEKIDSPEDILASLEKLNQQIGALTSETKKVLTEGLAEAKKQKVRTITHLDPKNLNAMTNDVKEYWGRAETLKNNLQKYKDRIDQCENIDPAIKTKIDNEITEIERAIPILIGNIKNDLKTYKMSRLAQMLEMIAKILGKLNEGMDLLRRIR